MRLTKNKTYDGLVAALKIAVFACAEYEPGDDKETFHYLYLDPLKDQIEKAQGKMLGISRKEEKELVMLLCIFSREMDRIMSMAENDDMD